MPGMLSFTPALGSAAAVGRANSFFSTPSAAQQQQQQLAAQRLARGADPQMAAPAPHPYSTTPSLAVPLDFPTPRVQPRAQMARNAAAATAAAAAAAAAAAMQFPNYRPHAAAPGTMGAVGTARINGPIPLSQFASGLPSAAGGRSLGAAGKLHFAALHSGNVTGLSVGEAASIAPPPGGPVRIARAPLRVLIQSCLARGHLGGAVFYADKLATLEGFSDASVLLLATAYARDRQHQRAVHLLRKHKLLQFPRDDLAEWRRQQQDHERRQLQRQQQAQSRPAGASAADDEDDSADPLSVRMECLYLGVQSLLEMKAVEEALAACLPESKENAAQLGMREAQEWEAQLAHVLAAIAPVQPEAATAGDEHSTAAAAAAAATTVREIIGEDETALVLALLKYNALQREKAASAARQRKLGQSTSALHPGAKQGHGAVVNDVLMSPAIGLGLDAHSVPLDDEADYDGPIDVRQHEHAETSAMSGLCPCIGVCEHKSANFAVSNSHRFLLIFFFFLCCCVLVCAALLLFVFRTRLAVRVAIQQVQIDPVVQAVAATGRAEPRRVRAPDVAEDADPAGGGGAVQGGVALPPEARVAQVHMAQPHRWGAG